MNILLYAPEYRPNLSNMIRSAEFYGCKRIYIYDKNRLLDPPNNKVGRSDMEHLARVWTAGAIEHIEVVKLDDPIQFLTDYSYDTIATIIDQDAENLHEARFLGNELLLMGSEKEGLPQEVIECCDRKIYLPHNGVTDCLNVSVALGIFVYAIQHQRLES